MAWWACGGACAGRLAPPCRFIHPAPAPAPHPLEQPRKPGDIHDIRDHRILARTHRRRAALAAGSLALALAAALGTHSAQAQEVIKIGALATLEGPFAVPGQDGMRGVDLAVAERKGTIAGKKIEIIKASSNGNPDTAVNAARKLVEQDGVRILIGPLSGSEGIAVKNYAKTHPEVTFVNGSSAAQGTTLQEPAPNFFRFSTDGAQWQAGLGIYAYQDKGYKRVVSVAEDYSFPYSLLQGFMIEFCKAGGKVVDKHWVPLGTKDYSSVIARLPDNIDAIYVALGGSDAVNFSRSMNRRAATSR